MKKDKNLEKLTEQYTPLIHHVMKGLYLNLSDSYYEDYLQELYIKLFEIAAAFDGDPLDKDNYRFTHYAKRGLRWHLIDLLRSAKKSNVEVPFLDIYFLDKEKVEHSEDSRLRLSSFYTEVKQKLTKQELTLLVEMIAGNHTLQELATNYGVSRKTISERKKVIRDKLHSLKEVLISE